MNQPTKYLGQSSSRSIVIVRTDKHTNTQPNDCCTRYRPSVWKVGGNLGVSPNSGGHGPTGRLSRRCCWDVRRRS